MPKNTKIIVRTTNGGEISGSLYENYRPTYDLVLTHNGREIIIAADRILSVTPTQ